MPSTNPNLMDTSPGGEQQNQYESEATFVQPPARSSGQLGGSSSHSKDAVSKDDLKTDEQKRERGEKTAENIRFGQSLSEHGFGGETTGLKGEAQRGEGSASEAKAGEEEEEDKARKQMGYGGGSGVGA